MKTKRIMICTILSIMLLCSMALAAEVPMEELAGANMFCENCGSDDACKDKIMAGEIKYHCDKTCTIKMKDKDGKELWFMRLNSACAAFSKNGNPQEVRALKDLTEPQNINGYLVKQFNNDYIWFDYSGQNRIIDPKTGTITEASLKTTPVNINSLKINTYGGKDKGGKITEFEVCGQKFYPRSRPLTSQFNINRPLMKDGRQACEITFYQTSNQNDVKKDKQGNELKEEYYQKCGDIQYKAYDNGLNTLSCDPKIEYTATGQEIRKKESKLYCSPGNGGCKLSTFKFDVYGETSGYPLGIQILGGKEAEKTDFKSVASRTDNVRNLPMKVLEANKYIIGSLSFTLKPKSGEKSEVRFVEEPLPTMYAPNGIELETHTDLGQVLTYKYIPEYTKPTDKKFDGYLFKFDPQKQNPILVYPVNFNLGLWDVKNMAESQLALGADRTRHAGVKPQVRFEGGIMTYKDGNPVYNNIIVEWRVYQDMLTTGAQKAVTVSPKTGAAKIECGPVNTIATRDYKTITEYVMEKLGYVKPKIALKPATTAPAPAKKMTGKGKRIKRPQAENEEEMVLMEPSELEPVDKTKVDTFVKKIIELNADKKFTETTGLKKNQQLKVPGELVDAKCKAQVNAATTKAKALAKPVVKKAITKVPKACTEPKFIDENGNCEIFVCDNNDDCTTKFGRGRACNEESWCDTLKPATEKAGTQAATTKDEVKCKTNSDCGGFSFMPAYACKDGVCKDYKCTTYLSCANTFGEKYICNTELNKCIQVECVQDSHCDSKVSFGCNSKYECMTY